MDDGGAGGAGLKTGVGDLGRGNGVIGMLVVVLVTAADGAGDDDFL
jgi:hypothetical protein